MNDAWIVTALSLVPKPATSRLMGRFARIRLPRVFHRALLGWYVRTYGVNLDECVGGIEDYDSLEDFFTRPLEPGRRPLDTDPDAIVSPVDARVYAVGTLNGHHPPAGGEGEAALADFDVRKLTGSDLYENGTFAVLYLSPRDYHRIHYPREGKVVGYRYNPGSLWPAFPASVEKIKGLFSQNERLAVRLHCQGLGELAVVLVGAFGVGRMTVGFCDLVTNTGGRAEDRELVGISAARGAELGRFHMGSTVILVAPAGTIAWELEVDQIVRVGRRIGRLTGSVG